MSWTEATREKVRTRRQTKNDEWLANQAKELLDRNRTGIERKWDKHNAGFLLIGLTDRGWSLTRLATLVGRSRWLVSRLVAAVRTSHEAHKRHLARVFGTPPYQAILKTPR